MVKRVLFFCLLVPQILLAQHSIKGTFSPAGSYSWCILYQVTPSNYMYVTDTKILAGAFELNIDSTRAAGVYKLVYGTPQEEKNFDLIYNGKEDIELSFSQDTGVTFVSSEENKALQDYEAEMAQLMADMRMEYLNDNPNTERLTELITAQRNLQINAKESSKDLMAYHFIKASQPYIPMGPEVESVYLENRRLDYWIPTDPTNPVLQNSSFILNRSLDFIAEFAQTNDPTSHREIDAIISFLGDMELPYQKSVLNLLWGKLVLQGRIQAANYLAESYLIHLSRTAGDPKLANYLTTFKNTSIGSIAPDFQWKEEKEGNETQQSLHALSEAENYVVVFWSSACSHCLNELPKLQKSLKNVPSEKFTVVAVGLEDEPYDWKNETYRYPEFTHVLGLGKWENEIGNAYAVSQTPTYYVLDADKKIIAKPETLESLQEFIAAKK